MIKLSRPPLEASESTYLTKKTHEIGASPDKKAAAANAWRNKSRDRFACIRKSLESAAPGREYCMYCLDSQGTAIDHFRPWSEDPLVTFLWDNYVLACSHCNSNEKRDQFPTDSSGNPILLNPFTDDPEVHLRLDHLLGERLARTQRGMTTITVFNLNRPHLTEGRIDAWIALEGLVMQYDDLISSGKTAKAEAYLATIHRAPFGEVLEEMRRHATSSTESLSDRLREIFQSHSEL